MRQIQLLPTILELTTTSQ
uniref:Uncharacterized protein n=1 Tax=Rhizophora mucronata TaxID=61149 RepID=A0A2P2QUU5_RHIMU